MKNYLGQAVGLSGLLIAFLAVVAAVSEDTVIPGTEISLRRMDIFSDIREKTQAPSIDSAALASVDTLVEPVSTDTTLAHSIDHPLPEKDPSVFGFTIEDYTYDQEGLSRFFKAVDAISAKQKKVRVAFFGDSFIEGDIFLGDLRDTLQTLWGGAGVGFVPMTSEVARFRRTFVQHYQGWRTYSIIRNEGNTAPLGINGHVYLPGAEAYSDYEGTSQYACRNTAGWSHVRLFYKAEAPTKFVWQLKNMPPEEATLPASNSSRLSVWEQQQQQRSITAFAVRFPQPDHLLVYGASLESGPGIYFDNFSVRGNAGGKLCQIPVNMMQAFQKHQEYELIILQFGLNAVTNSLRNINWYKAELEKTYEHVRASFPNIPVLVLSVPDRGGKVDGELTTMISVPYIVQMQRDLARKHGFMFYDFYHGMGGHGSMVRLSEARRPTLVNKDYTHLTHEGGRLMGLQFAALLTKLKGENSSTTY